jgi:DNA-binding transcriptional LysR family regulator
MTFEQLRTFLAVVDSGNFTEAANVLFMSQPAVSQHISALEKHVGHRLFDRNGRRLAITLAGERVLTYARQIVRESDALLADLKALDVPLQGYVTLGAINSVGIYSLPAMIARFQAAYPSIRVGLKVGNTERIVDELHRGEVDLALIDSELPPSHTRLFRREPYQEEEQALIVPPDHPWAGRNDLRLSELYGETWVMRDRRSHSRQVLELSLAKVGVDVGRLTTALDLDSTEAIKQAVGAGLGVGFVPECAIVRELAWGILARAHLKEGRLQRAIWLYSPLRRGIPLRIQAFHDYLQTGELSHPAPEA